MRAAKSGQTEQLKVAKLPHIEELDGLRAIAVGMVFVAHSHLAPFIPGGFGVTIFFFLSGYLITTLMRLERAQTGNVSLRGFYLRRFLRINPPLWISMFAVWLMLEVGWIDMDWDWKGILSQFFFYSNYMVGNPDVSRLPMPLWSLAVEEHFYLIFPLVFICAMRWLNIAQFAKICMMACVAVLGMRLLNIYALGIVSDNYYWTHTRIDSIIFGCILALWQNPIIEKNPVWRPSHLHFGGGMLVILGTFIFRDEAFREGLRYTIQGGALLVVFSYILQEKGVLSRFLQLRPLQILGLYSYTFYLIHYPAIYAARNCFPNLPVYLQIAIAGAASLVFCALMHRLVEKPLAALRRKMSRPKTSQT